MTKTEALSVIREACIKANPEIEKRRDWEKVDPQFIGTEKGIEYLSEAPIRLADVLLAIEMPCGAWITSTDFHCFHAADTDEELVTWNLRQDSLESQSPETLEFLAGLLVDK